MRLNNGIRTDFMVDSLINMRQTTLTVDRRLREKTITDLNNLLQYMAEIKDDKE